jgi:hypothetical protein
MPERTARHPQTLQTVADLGHLGGLADMTPESAATGMVADRHDIDWTYLVAGAAEAEHRRGVAQVTIGHG